MKNLGQRSGVSHDSARSAWRFIWASRAREAGEEQAVDVLGARHRWRMRGSRLVGLDSRRKVRELGLVEAVEEQDAQNEVMKQRSNEVTRRAERACRRLALFTSICAGAGVKPRSLHCAARRVRGSEREEQASARFGRNDSVAVVSAGGAAEGHCGRLLNGPRRLTRRGIGDFAEDCRTAGASRGRELDGRW